MARQTPTFCLVDFKVAATVLSQQPLGYGYLAWIHMEPTHPDLVLPESDHNLIIHESGHVPVLIAENPTRKPILIIRNLTLVGGLQTRTLERTIIIPPKCTVTIPVKCVERGRWSPSPNDPYDRFSLSGRLDLRMRHRLSVDQLKNLQQHRIYEAAQFTVWNEVDHRLGEFNVDSPTDSYQDFLEKRRKMINKNKLYSIRPHPEANGVMIFTRSGFLSIEVLPKVDHLFQYRSLFLEDLFDPRLNPPNKKMTPPAFADILEDLLMSPLVSIPKVPGCIGQTFVTKTNRFLGEVTLFEKKIAHASFSVQKEH